MEVGNTSYRKKGKLALCVYQLTEAGRGDEQVCWEGIAVYNVSVLFRTPSESGGRVYSVYKIELSNSRTTYRNQPTHKLKRTNFDMALCLFLILFELLISIILLI